MTPDALPFGCSSPVKPEHKRELRHSDDGSSERSHVFPIPFTSPSSRRLAHRVAALAGELCHCGLRRFIRGFARSDYSDRTRG
jgi:hypothetical protein